MPQPESRAKSCGGLHRAQDEPADAVAHRAAPRPAWPWLPLQEGATLAPHPYCADCGLVRFVGSRRALDLGGLMNLLARLDRALRVQGRPLTEAQRRLIVRRLRAHEADDPFALSRDAQLRVLASVVSLTVGVPERTIASYLRSC